MKRPRVRLKKDLARSIRAGHPWVYADALSPAPVATGTAVDIVGADGKFLARGLYDAASPIAVRVLTLDEGEQVDEALVRRRLSEALGARRGAVDARETDAFRLCNGEGDYLPGVVVDLYASVAVVRIDGEAARALVPWVVKSIFEVCRPLGITSIYERSRAGRGALLSGAEPPDVVEVRESGVRFLVDVKRGQKTGTFLDQRENRRAIRPYCGDIEVANLFSYTGGFSLHAALGGARRVVSVDQAAPALATARENFSLNRIDPSRHEFVAEDAFSWLERAAREGRRYGLLIVDPPSFAPSERALQTALTAYRKLFAASLAAVEPGGVLAAASCSSHVTQEAFLGVLRDAAVRDNRRLRILEIRGQPADHPSLPAFPEGRYLKFVLCRAA